MRIHTPRSTDADWADALAEAIKQQEPLFKPVRPHVDDRGWSFMNLMTGVMTESGQINFSVQHPGVIKAWHRHKHQTDFWTCPIGHLKAGVYREDDKTAWSLVIGEVKPGVLIIPPPLWHGAATVGASHAGLLYYVTKAYDSSEPDEERAAYDCFEDFNWEVDHR